MFPLRSAASLVLLEFRQSHGLGFLAPNGRIVTCLHLVVDEAHVIAHFHDGRALNITTATAIDTKRDLAVLDAGEVDVPPLRPSPTRTEKEETGCFVFGMVERERRARWVDTSIEIIQPLDAALSIYRLKGTLPRDASGGPLVRNDGMVCGVVSVAESDDGGLFSLAIPWKYVEPLLHQNGRVPITSIKSPERKSGSIGSALQSLEGSSLIGLQAASKEINVAIRKGVPAASNATQTFQIYAHTARRLIISRSDCPGLQALLRAGLARAESLSDHERRALALRETLDGVLSAIEQYIRGKTGEKKLLN